MAVRIITQKTGTPEPMIVTPNSAAQMRVKRCTCEREYVEEVCK